MAQAGYPNGFDVPFNTSPTRWSEGPDIVQAIASDLGKVGIRTKIQNQEWATYVDMLWSGKPHDLYIRTWSTADKLDADTPLFLILRSGNASSTYSNPDVDKLLDAERHDYDPMRARTLR